MQLACYLYCRLQGAQAPIGNRLEKPDRRKPTKPRVFSVTACRTQRNLACLYLPDINSNSCFFGSQFSSVSDVSWILISTEASRSIWHQLLHQAPAPERISASNKIKRNKHFRGSCAVVTQSVLALNIANNADTR